MGEQNRMVNRRIFLGVSAVSVAFGLNGCGVISTKRNYRIAVEVEVDGKVYQGSSVQRFKTRPGLTFTGMDTIQSEAFGEAVVVSLGDRGKLFVVMRDGHRDPVTGKQVMDDDDLMLFKLKLTDGRGHGKNLFGTWKIPVDEMPVMVKFGDTSDPKTVERVDPANLSASFGPGVRLIKLTVGLTWQPVTKDKILKVLPWLKGKADGTLLNGSRGRSSQDRTLAGQLFISDFMKDY